MMPLLNPTLKSLVKTHLPRGVNLGPAVVQLFLNDERTTRLGLINFPSFLAPADAVDYRYVIRAYDGEGREAGAAVIAIRRYGSAEVDLREQFGAKLPPFGMVSARIHPVNFLSISDRHLGRIRPHFFTLYASERMNSLGLVHPQTSFGAKAAPNRRWVSNLQIDPSSVDRVELFQINPGRTQLDSEAFLQNETGEVLSRTRAQIPSRGTRRVVFDLEPYAKSCGAVSVGLNGLAAANGKPILFLHFRHGSFTCCHA